MQRTEIFVTTNATHNEKVQHTETFVEYNTQRTSAIFRCAAPLYLASVFSTDVAGRCPWCLIIAFIFALIADYPCMNIAHNFTSRSLGLGGQYSSFIIHHSSLKKAPHCPARRSRARPSLRLAWSPQHGAWLTGKPDRANQLTEGPRRGGSRDCCPGCLARCCCG